jgi:hypothetical protein
MISTRVSRPDSPPFRGYLGVDTTDAFAARRRSFDVCGLLPDGARLLASFWTWAFDGEGIGDVRALAEEVRAARGTVIDAPQALARAGEPMRQCERLTRAPGHTPDRMPDPGRPFAGFVRTGVLLFDALVAAGVPIAEGELVGGAAEFFPGSNWSLLAGERLPKKETPEGRQARRALLERLGVVFPRGSAPTHDGLDACLGALIAAAADGRLPGSTVERVGAPLERGGSSLREGYILRLCLPTMEPHDATRGGGRRPGTLASSASGAAPSSAAARRASR